MYKKEINKFLHSLILLPILTVNMSNVGLAKFSRLDVDSQNKTSSVSYISRAVQFFAEKKSDKLALTYDNNTAKSDMPAEQTPIQVPKQTIVGQLEVRVTSYSSTVEETDSDPFITASGKYVEDGIVANNLFPFGTKVMFPEIFGDKVFIVQDRMNPKVSVYSFDIWSSSTQTALDFGTKKTTVVIIQ
jgi:3D (Asp-Asp-Asp) domain-containing protein